MYADVVSTIALAAALGSVAWQVGKEMRWDKPRLTVSGRLIYAARSDSKASVVEFWDLEIIVANIGNIATQVVDVYWEFESTSTERFLIRGSEMDDGSFTHEFNGEAQVYDGTLKPSIPLKLGRNDGQEWMFERPRSQNAMIDTATRGRPVVVYVARSRRDDRLGGHPNRALEYGEWKPVVEFPKMVGALGL